MISRSANIKLFHRFILTSVLFLTNEACQILRLKSFVENSIFAYLNFLQFVHIKPIDGFVRICNISFAKLLRKSIKTTHIQRINLIYPSFVTRIFRHFMQKYINLCHLRTKYFLDCKYWSTNMGNISTYDDIVFWRLLHGNLLKFMLSIQNLSSSNDPNQNFSSKGPFVILIELLR